MYRKRSLFLILALVVMVTSCAQPSATPERVIETVVVTQPVEVTKLVPQEVTVTKEIEITKEVPIGGQADRAIQLGKQFTGTELTIRYEQGTAGPLYAFAPEWEKNTGIKVNVVEVPYGDQYTLGLQDAAAKDSGVDIFLTTYSWLPDWVAAGAVQPIDQWVEKYMTEEDLADIEEVHRLFLTNYGDKMWGLPVDGDAFIIYYRKDLFEDEEYKAAFQTQYNRELVPPKTLEEYGEVAEFFSSYTNGKVWGFGEQRDFSIVWFLQYYQSQGGKLFDVETMRPLLNEQLAVQTVEWMNNMGDYGAPGNGTWGFADVWGSFLTGKLAMTITWPPVARFAEAASGLSNYPTWLPATEIAGKVGYAPAPLGTSQLASNYIWTINANSQNPEAAFAFMMWYASPQYATQVSLWPNSTTDPLRYSQYNSPVYRNHWPSAGEYLDTLLAGSKCGMPDIKLPGGGEYNETLQRHLAEVWTGAATPQQAMDDAVADWEEITDRLGRDKQREAYQDLLKLMDQAAAFCETK